MAPVQRVRPYSGPALFSYGFRPFFLLGSLFAGVAVLAWLPAYFGEWELPIAIAQRDWHVHEMIYGYGAAVIAGFLLTAIPNWTGHLPLQGRPLIALTALWLAGRLAMAFSLFIGPWVAAAIDLAFLAAVIGFVVRELRQGSQQHNRKVVVVLAILWIGDLVFHVEAIGFGGADFGVRIGLAARLILVMLIGGRIIPSFTRNWLARVNPGPLPAPLDRFDIAAILVAALALAAWIVAPQGRLVGAALLVAGLAQAARLARWRGYRAWRDRLVLVLHIAYAFIPIGFVLTALSAFRLMPISAGEHAWAIGVFGGMTIAVMSRASLGHTGRALVASPAVQAIYALLFGAVVARVCAAVVPEWAWVGLHVSAFAWAAAFFGFALAYWRPLAGPRRSG
ncbi:MAG: NnrS family protein [Roseiarcus sp.]